MELLNRNGGKLIFYQIYQNGFSVDLMYFMMRNGYVDYSFDMFDIVYYFLIFDDVGRYLDDLFVQVDFEIMVCELLVLKCLVECYGLWIEKVIIKLEYKDYFFNIVSGKLLLWEGVYFV